MKTTMIDTLCIRLLDIFFTTISCKLCYVNEIADSLQCIRARKVEDKKGMRASDGRSPIDTSTKKATLLFSAGGEAYPPDF